jgi:hypothetical protein
MQIVKFVVMAILFVILTPGVLVWLPSGSSKNVAAIVHGIVFAAVWYLIYELIESIENTEGLTKKCSKAASIGCFFSGGKLCKNAC